MTELSSKAKAAMRNTAQRLKPAIFVGKGGISPGLVAQLNQFLDLEELVKVAFKASREELDALVAEIETKTGASCVGGVGKRRSFYRVSSEKK